MRYLILFLLMVCAQTSLGQRYLYVHKAGNPKAYTLASGDEIVFRLQGEKHFRKDLIHTFTDTSIVFNYSNVPIKAIHAIQKKSLRKSDLSYGLAQALKYAGAGYLLIDVFNSTLVDGEDFNINKNTAVISSSMFLSGFILSQSTKRFVKIKTGAYSLKILER